MQQRLDSTTCRWRDSAEKKSIKNLKPPKKKLEILLRVSSEVEAAASASGKCLSMSLNDSSIFHLKFVLF